MKGIELEILWNREENFSLVDLGIKIDDDDYELRPMTFFVINSIARSSTHKEKGYSLIYSNGECFVCTMNYESLKTKLSTSI